MMGSYPLAGQSLPWAAGLPTVSLTRPWHAGVALLYLGAALLAVRLASETTILYYERHLIWGAKFDRCFRTPTVSWGLPYT